MLVRHGDSFGIIYATNIDSEGFQRFSIAHELGHYLLEGHIDHVLPPGANIHTSSAGFASYDQYEREADYFAVGLLMPGPLFTRAMIGLDDGLAAVEALSAKCHTSLTATAIRYVEKTSIPAAVIMSTGPRIDYCFLSKEMEEFPELTWPRKGDLLPAGVATERFNATRANITSGRKITDETSLRVWFGGPKVSGTEEVIGLGSYGKTLTVITADTFADDLNSDDADEDLDESYTPRFRR